MKTLRDSEHIRQNPDWRVQETSHKTRLSRPRTGPPLLRVHSPEAPNISSYLPVQDLATCTTLQWHMQVREPRGAKTAAEGPVPGNVLKGTKCPECGSGSPPERQFNPSCPVGESCRKKRRLERGQDGVRGAETHRGTRSQGPREHGARGQSCSRSQQ